MSIKCSERRIPDNLDTVDKPLGIERGWVDEIYGYIAQCPSCGMEWAMYKEDKMRYCPGCGKRVKWIDSPR